MNNDNDNSIFFLTISLICIWLIVDYVVGKQYIGKFISMLPFMSDYNPIKNPEEGAEVNINNPNRNQQLLDAGLTEEQIARIPEIIKKIKNNGGDYSCLTEEERKIMQIYGEVNAGNMI